MTSFFLQVRSEDQAIHYEAVGVIGNLVHSSAHIKRRVLDEGALQPVIGKSLLSKQSVTDFDAVHLIKTESHNFCRTLEL